VNFWLCNFCLSSSFATCGVFINLFVTFI